MLGVAASVPLWPVAALGREPRAEVGQAASAGQTLLPVVLPDVSRLHESVQRQLREAYASLMADESSANAFGQMGMLFMATRFSDDARVCFQNAQRLAWRPTTPAGPTTWATSSRTPATCRVPPRASSARVRSNPPT